MSIDSETQKILGDGFLAIHHQLLASPEAEQHSLQAWLAWLNLEGYEADQFCSCLRSLCEQILGPEDSSALLATVQSMAEAPDGIETLVAHLEQDYPQLLSTLQSIEVTRQEELERLSTMAGGTHSKKQKIGQDIAITYLSAGLTVAVGAGIHDYLRRRKIDALESIEREKSRLADGTIKDDEAFVNDMLRDANRRGWSVDEMNKIKTFEPDDLLRLAKNRDYASKVEERFDDLLRNPELLRENRMEIFRGLTSEYRNPETRKLMSEEEKRYVEDYWIGEDRRLVPKDDQEWIRTLEPNPHEWDRLVGNPNLQRSRLGNLMDKWNGRTNGNIDFQQYADQKIKSEILNDLIKKDYLATIDDMDAYFADLELDGNVRYDSKIYEGVMKEIKEEESRLESKVDKELTTMEEDIQADITSEENKITNDTIDGFEDAF